MRKIRKADRNRRKHKYKKLLNAGYKIKKFGNYCKCCGSQSHLTLDHIVPKCKGGNNNPTNLQVLCQKCNTKKADKIIDYRKNSYINGDFWTAGKEI